MGPKVNSAGSTTRRGQDKTRLDNPRKEDEDC